MRNVCYIATLFLVLGCTKQSTETRYYPSKSSFPIEKIELVDLDTVQLNFKELTNKIARYYNEEKRLFVEFNDSTIKKQVIPYTYDGGLVKFKNVLRIKSDSILIDNGYPISELKRILKRHFENKGRVPHYSDAPERALVEVTIDTSMNGKELKEVLIKITRAFDEINEETKDTLKLRVFFDYFRQLPLPPPPPNMKSKYK
ncbi:hypothetical protein EV197_2518 [Aquimarina brevivitae]|uniref:Uncharacterized protein n=2 Tax=Aquimarina brevivitae TaxID=323412 RepID=A0A4Q7P2T9_9FLAO|nr:hypothetical protein EV197_2518 [Aquimarina brevivitae]